MERHLNAKAPISLVFAVPDHPWSKATRDSAAVRIAMTVAQAGKRDGALWEVMAEQGLDTDDPRLEFRQAMGQVNPDLTIGVDVTKAAQLLANEGLSSPGVKLHGAGFIVTRTDAALLGLGLVPGIEAHLRPYRNGRDLTARSRNAMVIDLYGVTEPDLRKMYPSLYQHLYQTVRPARTVQAAKSPTADAQAYLQNWWIFGKPRPEMRAALNGIEHYLVTVETAKHRVFQFLDSEILPDNKLIVMALADAAALAVLSSRIHTHWALVAGGWLGVGNDPVYVKTNCFDRFPFPDLDGPLRGKLRALAQELDATRKRVLADHPDLTLTGLYNILEKLRAGAPLTPADEDIKHRGLVLILKELHDQIDRLTADAYGWPHDLTDQQILERLVALNAERAKEEAAGQVRWLRPDYQIPRFAKGAAAKTGELDLGEAPTASDAGLPAFPKEAYEQPLAVKATLMSLGRPLDASELSRAFKGPPKARTQRIAQILATLALYGEVDDSGSGKYTARRAA